MHNRLRFPRTALDDAGAGSSCAILVGPERRAELATSARYDFGMTTKITVSLPDEAVAAAKQAVAEGRAPSVSAYVADALEYTYGKRRPLAEVIAEMRAESGAPTAADDEWARRALGLA